MGSVVNNAYLSAIDGERFGIRIARAPEMTLEVLPSVIEFCRDNAVSLLIARCPVSELRAAQAMERQGFELMDTLVYYERDLVQTPVPPGVSNIKIRAMRLGEEEKIKTIAAESFRGYSGHYHADKRLDRTKCDEVYISWAYRSCISRDVADVVLVADMNGSMVGFAAMRLNNAEEGEGILFGVAPFARGQGVYRSLIIYGMKWCVNKGVSRMIYSTQITNLAVQKVLTGVGFEPRQAYYTFHKWFD